MHSFLREDVYSETKHLSLCFCVHNASLLAENGPKVERHVSSRGSPALWEAAEWPRLLFAGTTAGPGGEWAPTKEHVPGRRPFPASLHVPQCERRPDENPCA